MRGNRVQLLEVERALRSHSGVDQAAAALREVGGQPQLMGYVVRRQQADSAAAEAYGRLIGSAAAHEAVTDPDYDLRGWRDSYSGAPIPAWQMRTLVDGTARLLRALRPRRVLEIGCGTGLLLQRLVGDVERYVGTDLSAEPLELLRRRLSPAEADRTELLELEAADVGRLGEEQFDLVVLNSVVQYFPGEEHLRRVLAGAVSAVAAGGHVYVGDVRSMPLAPALHLSIELARGGADLRAGELRDRVERRSGDEPELLVHPGLFASLGGRVGHVRLMPRRSRSLNELTRFRYDALLGVGEPGDEPVQVPAWRSWEEVGGSTAGLRQLVRRHRPEVLGVAGVPSVRAAREAAAIELLARADADAPVAHVLRELVGAPGGVEPEDLWTLGAELGYHADVSLLPVRSDGALSLCLWRSGAARVRFPAGPRPVAWTNVPLEARSRIDQPRFLAELREHLRRRLPEHMVPGRLVELSELPLNASWTVPRCRIPGRSGPSSRRGTWLRGARWRRSWRGSGPRRSGSSGWARRTASSSWAATPSWPCR